MTKIFAFAVLGTLCFFGYLMYNNGMDAVLAFGEVKGLWVSIVGWFQRAGDWILSQLPF